MKHVVLAHLKPDSGTAIRALRLKHLEYIEMHKASILAGGPSISASGVPLTMILFTQFTDAAAAASFMAKEPYNASGMVFERVEIFAWSQVLPEQAEGALASEIEKERQASPNA